MSGDGQWKPGDPPEGWWQASDERWYPPVPPPPDEAADVTERLDQAPGAADPTAAYPPPDAPAPGRLSAAADTYRGWPRWAKIAAPVAAGVLGLGVIGAIVGEPEDETAAIATTEESTTTERPTTTQRPTTTTTRPTTTTTRPTTTTAPPTTAPPTTVPPPPTTAAPAPPPPPPPSDAGCHPSYDPCVPIASDVDCAGGSGNGPAYVGRVNVIGPDVYGLDADGDGVGCE
jgi:hypothetical protein